MPPLILSALGLLLPIFGLPWVLDTLVYPMVKAIHPTGEYVPVKLWQGFNLPLLLSAVTVIMGIIGYVFLRPIYSGLTKLMRFIPSGFLIFFGILDGILAFAKFQMKIMQSKKLSVYTSMFFGTLALFLIYIISTKSYNITFPFRDIRFYEWMLAALIIVAGIVTTVTPSRLLAICSLGMIGFITAIIFMIYGAPDVSKTQLLVETLLVVFLALIMHNLPILNDVKSHPLSRKILHLGIATVIGFFTFIVLVEILNSPLDTTIPDYFGMKSMPEGYGRNIVNVILVDFRAFDTLGEVVVVVIAAISSAYLFRSKKKPKRKARL